MFSESNYIYSLFIAELTLLHIVLIGVGIYVFFFVLCANIAKGKGYDPLLGIIIAFLIGPLAVIILLLVPSKRETKRINVVVEHRHPKNKFRHKSHRRKLQPPGRLNNPTGSNFVPSAIPNAIKTQRIACPHCDSVLNVSEPGEYTCPNCQQLFIY